LLPLALGAGTQFLGKDVSSVAAGVVSFYPGIAALEVARVLGFAFAVLLVATLGARSCAAKAPGGPLRWLIFPGTVVLALLLLNAASIVQYPALFEAFLSPAVQRGVHALAGWTSPAVLRISALVVLALPALAFSRRALLAPALLASVLHAPELPSFKTTAIRPTRPHILLVAIDSLRFDRLARADVLPTVSSLLQDPSVVSFQDHQVGVPRTFPSWIEILEGRNAPRTGIRHMFPGFGPRSGERRGLATALRDAGYDTVAIADFAGDVFPRFEAGFKRVRAPKLTLRTMIRMSVDQAFPAFLPLMTAPRVHPWFAALKESPVFGDAGHLVDTAVEELAARDDDTPLFMTLFLSTAHFPYAAPHPYYRLFTDSAYAGSFLFHKNPELSADSVTEADIAQVRGLYDGALRAIDDELARLFGVIRARGLWDDTLIVITADHGEDLFEDGRLQGHGEHLRGENVLHVPLVLKLPAPLSPPRSIPHLSRSIDIAPTLASFVGAPKWSTDGHDFTPWLRGDRSDDPGLSAYAETGIWFSRGGAGFYQSNRLDYPGISGMLSFDQGYTGEIVLNPVFEEIIVTAKHRALITGTHKLIYVPGPSGVSFQLYDRRADPASRTDLAASDPERLAALRARFWSLVTDLEAPGRGILDGYVVRQ
jgi:arylsulfatase A-like enzyme